MEKVCKVIAVGTAQTREVPMKDGTKKVFKTINVRLADAVDEFIAEAEGNLADMLEHNPLPVGTNVSVGVSLRVGEWKDKDGNARTSTFISLRALRVL